jgi:hypothetical protein
VNDIDDIVNTLSDAAHLRYDDNEVKQMLEFNTSIKATQIVLSVTATTFAATFAIVSALVPNPKTIFDAAVASAVAVANALIAACTIVEFINQWNTYNDYVAFVNDLKKIQPQLDLCETVANEIRGTLADPNCAYGSKKIAAEKIMKAVNNNLAPVFSNVINDCYTLDDDQKLDFLKVINITSDVDNEQPTEDDIENMEMKGFAYTSVADSFITNAVQYGNLIEAQLYAFGITSIFTYSSDSHTNDLAETIKN